MDGESFRQILREELNMRKVCAKMVPKLLSDEQKERRKELCLDLLQHTENEPHLLNLLPVTSAPSQRSSQCPKEPILCR